MTGVFIRDTQRGDTLYYSKDKELPAYHQKLGKARKDLSITLKGI
jgi:hypothetical protein